jgi:hypothetical protein
VATLLTFNFMLVSIETTRTFVSFNGFGGWSYKKAQKEQTCIEGNLKLIMNINNVTRPQNAILVKPTFLNIPMDQLTT